MAYIILVAGFLLLVKGADIFVSGSSAIARYFNIPAFIIGLTVVAFGTSMPEAAISVTAALKGANGIAVGNALGSNLFNLLVVLGASALIRACPVSRETLRFEYPLSIIAVMLLLVMSGGFGMGSSSISRIDGIILLALFVIFMIGLTIVALGTSLPELVISVVAALKGETDIAVGNVIGSNIFNLLLVLGLSATIHPIGITILSIYDMIILIAVSLIVLIPLIKNKKLTRGWGVIMLIIYVAYLAYIIARTM